MSASAPGAGFGEVVEVCASAPNEVIAARSDVSTSFLIMMSLNGERLAPRDAQSNIIASNSVPGLAELVSMATLLMH